MVELQGLKPWTSSMPWKRSNQLSYSPLSGDYPITILTDRKPNLKLLEKSLAARQHKAAQRHKHCESKHKPVRPCLILKW